MSEQIHTTSTPTAALPTNLLADFRKLIPTLVLTILTAFATSWYNGQKSQQEINSRVANVEQRSLQNAENIKQNSQLLQSNAIRMAEVGVIQTTTLEQIKDLKQEQNEIRILLNRK